MNVSQDTFREEAEELLTDLESALLELEEHPTDPDLVARVFRAMHTIKGTGAMFGFDRLSAFTHCLENAFDRVRNGKLAVTSELIDLGLRAKDHIRNLLQESSPTPELEAAGSALLARLSELAAIPGSQTAAPVKTTDPLPRHQETTAEVAYHIQIRPATDALTHSMDPLPILRELAALGSCHVTTFTADVPTLAELDPERCYVAWDVILVTDRGRDAVDDVFIFVHEDWSITVEVILACDDGRRMPHDKLLGEILVARGDATPEQVAQALSQQGRIGEILSELGYVQPEKVKAALGEQRAVRRIHEQRRARETAALVKVPADRLDCLMDLVGELVIAQAHLSQTANGRDDPELVSIAEEMERLTTELRDTTLELRMLPIGTTFSRFRRLVRDLSAELGKEIELVTEGAETELDKTVIDQLGDPLVHLIRNSIDHGVERPAVREAAGKPHKGTVRLSAIHSESHVVIRVEDDGAGLDPDAIRAKAVERGLLAKEAEPSPEALYKLVFEPGFSTAKAVSNISGRGVGMDVVKRSIDALRGKVWIDSRPGQGTTVTVELPLTLAIIEGLLVKVADERYVLPLSLVEECIELSGAAAKNAHGHRLVEVRGELVPCLRLREWFGDDGKRPAIEQTVVTRLGQTRFGFTVDQVIGQHQTVIKSLGKLYEGLPGLAGATILGDGAVALILDVPKLAHATSVAATSLHRSAAA